MNKDQREIQRKLRILQYADEICSVVKACRYFGVGRSSFYRWCQAYAERGEAGLINAPPIPKWHANRASLELEEKVLYLRRKYHFGPMRIVWYLTRYYNINISDATVSRILRGHGLNRLSRGTRIRKVHTKRYQKQVASAHPIVQRDHLLLVLGEFRVGANFKSDMLLPVGIGYIRKLAGFSSARLEDVRKQEIFEDLVSLTERPRVPAEAVEPDGVRCDPQPARRSGHEMD